MRRGLIEVTGTGARNCREYGITEPGRAELKDWLSRPGADTPYRSAALGTAAWIGDT